MKTLVTMMAAAVAFAAVAQEPAAPAAARPERRQPRMMHTYGMSGGQLFADPVVRAAMNPRAAEVLGLTDEQKAKLRALRNTGGNRELQAKLQKAMERQTELLKAETLDESAVMAVIDEIFDTRKEIAKEQIRTVIAAKAVLTPEQLAKARELGGKDLRGGGRKKGGKSRPAAKPKAEAPKDE